MSTLKQTVAKAVEQGKIGPSTLRVGRILSITHRLQDKADCWSGWDPLLSVFGIAARCTVRISGDHAWEDLPQVPILLTAGSGFLTNLDYHVGDLVLLANLGANYNGDTAVILGKFNPQFMHTDAKTNKPGATNTSTAQTQSTSSAGQTAGTAGAVS